MTENNQELITAVLRGAGIVDPAHVEAVLAHLAGKQTPEPFTVKDAEKLVAAARAGAGLPSKP